MAIPGDQMDELINLGAFDSLMAAVIGMGRSNSR